MRLMDPAGSDMPLRPQLEEVKGKLLTMLSGTVEKPGANSSYLLIGPRGTGKTLVSHYLFLKRLLQRTCNEATPSALEKLRACSNGML